MMDDEELVARLIGIEKQVEQAADRIGALSAELDAMTARAEAAEAEAHSCGAERAAWKERAEAVEARVAGAYLAAAEVCREHGRTRERSARAILALTPADADAALRKVREDALREAAEEVGGYVLIGGDKAYTAIMKLIGEPK